ncbi:nuclear transport factor 2 family protein [Natronosporangium hydrolyticum]|uniref:Nuclear transport factor 2 family protein n=1 Tax=Natronosporangium hydrolyticum TaxID=2811111 RepID=A0A895YK01_9ACTN|nr:nuclear transport factor 2 family protein [Natronosporangium hydrolyticum]QSB14936.1 nuclear transport factor 2 family protein [Natronosporangium hydrolyticum]
MRTADEIRKIFISAVATGDVAELVSLYQPDAVLEAPEGRYEGSAEIEAYFEAQLTPFDAALQLVATYDHREVAITEWVLEMTHVRPIELPTGEALPATGRHLRQRGVDVAELADGQFRYHRVYYDQRELLEQLGLIETVEV